MQLSAEGRLRRAAQLVLVGSALGSLVLSASARAQDDSSAANTDSSSTSQLKGVQITGSLLRRVDTATSNPVLTVSRKQLLSAGVTNVGQMLQQLPVLTGAQIGQQVNNGGTGDGSATLSLRGLGSSRTLVLLDGRRIVSSFGAGAVDINTIPINMVERIEVLKEGASTAYGSDAIGGVVNIITRKHFTGTEATIQYGEATDHGDGSQVLGTLTAGRSTDHGHVVGGLSFEKDGSIAAYNRDVGRAPYALYYNAVTVLGSSRIPGGIFNTPSPITLPNGQSCTNPTRVIGTNGTSLVDFKCPNLGFGPGNDRYNYQTDNLLLTPARRASAFIEANQELTDTVQGYFSGFFTNVQGHNQLAPEAFDTSTVDPFLSTPLQISQYSQYNPFGQDVTSFEFRADQIGNRVDDANKNTFQGTAGLKATLFNRFEWDNSFTYGESDLTQTNYGYINLLGLQQALGPSRNGVCYADSAYSIPIPGCTPINMIGTTGKGYASLSGPVTETTQSAFQMVQSKIDGDLFRIPLTAGPVNGAAGVEYRQYRYEDIPDALQQQFALSESNTQATSGRYDVKEVYGEFLIPLIKNVPLIHSLNVDVGTRYSDYSSFGSTVNSKYALEYRPLDSLLVRATYADVFRAPTVTELYQGGVQSAPSYTDPCNGYTGSPTSAFPHLPDACQNVPTNGSFAQKNSQATGVNTGNPKLQPETGFTTDFGLVYNPNWYRPLTVSADYWKYELKNTITALDLQTELNACAASGSPEYCSLISRVAGGANAGQVNNAQQPTANLGGLVTTGFDFGMNLDYASTPYGSFHFGLNGTYLQKFLQTVAVAGQQLSSYSLAGQNSGPIDTVGGSEAGSGYPRLRFVGTLSWDYDNWAVVLRNRFIASEVENGGQDGAGNYYGLDVSGAGYIGNAGLYPPGTTGQGQCNTGIAVGTVTFPDGGGSAQYICRRNIGFVDYQDAQVSYTFKTIGTTFSAGVNDMFDQRAPITYTYGPNFNYDASNYSVIGRYVYGSMKIRFK